MPKYINQTCISCNEKLTENSDIVVCPECGTPYHRECYLSQGKCINEALHQNGESWKPEQEETPEAKTAVCPNCGFENAEGYNFCANCGKAAEDLNDAEPRFDGVDSQAQSPFGSFAESPFQSAVKLDTDLNGVTVGEYARYIGPSIFHFLPKFLRFSKGTKTSGNFAAFFIPHLYFFYRKMFKEGIIVALSVLVLSIPDAFETLKDMAIDIPLPAFVDTQWFATLSMACSLVMTAIRIVIFLYANYFYYKKATADIKKIKSEVLEPNSCETAIKNAGGVSIKYAIIAYLALSVLTSAILFLLTSFLL